MITIDSDELENLMIECGGYYFLRYYELEKLKRSVKIGEKV